MVSVTTNYGALPTNSTPKRSNKQVALALFAVMACALVAAVALTVSLSEASSVDPISALARDVHPEERAAAFEHLKLAIENKLVAEITNPPVNPTIAAEVANAQKEQEIDAKHAH